MIIFVLLESHTHNHICTRTCMSVSPTVGAAFFSYMRRRMRMFAILI